MFDYAIDENVIWIWIVYTNRMDEEALASIKICHLKSCEYEHNKLPQRNECNPIRRIRLVSRKKWVCGGNYELVTKRNGSVVREMSSLKNCISIYCCDSVVVFFSLIILAQMSHHFDWNLEISFWYSMLYNVHVKRIKIWQAHPKISARCEFHSLRLWCNIMLTEVKKKTTLEIVVISVMGQHVTCKGKMNKLRRWFMTIGWVFVHHETKLILGSSCRNIATTKQIDVFAERHKVIYK